MSHTALTYHIIFGTYQRHNSIIEQHERELYKFLYDLASKKGILVRRIDGMPDHIHILCDIPAKIALAEFVKLVKTETSKFMRVNPHFPFWSGWAEGYGAFTVDASNRNERVNYIMNQKAHHKNICFADEYFAMLAAAQIPYDEK